MNAVSESKRKYGAQDLTDYAEYHGVGYRFTSHFPFNSILPLRVTVASPDDQLRQVICKYKNWVFSNELIMVELPLRKI